MSAGQDIRARGDLGEGDRVGLALQVEAIPGAVDGEPAGQASIGAIRAGPGSPQMSAETPVSECNDSTSRGHDETGGGPYKRALCDQTILFDSLPGVPGAGSGDRVSLALPIESQAAPCEGDGEAPGATQTNAAQGASGDDSRGERNETGKQRGVIRVQHGTVADGYHGRTTLDVLWLACSLPSVDAVFSQLPRTDDETARGLAYTLIAMYEKQGDDFAAYLQRVEGGKTDPRRRKHAFSIDGGRYGVVQQGDQNVITINTNVTPDDDISILQQGYLNAININLSVALPDTPASAYDLSSTKEARQTVVQDMVQFLQRHIGGEDVTDGRSGSLQSPTSPVNAAAVGTPVDPPDAAAADEAAYSLYASSKLSAFGSHLKQEVEAALGLAAGGPVHVKDVANEGNGRLRVTLAGQEAPRPSTGKEPSSLVILKLRGPLNEFERKKTSLRSQLSRLLHCPPGDIQFIRATAGGSVRVLAAMPAGALARLLRLALLQPSVLRSVGVYLVALPLHPASVDVGNGVDVTVTNGILDGALCQALCDGLFDTFHLSGEQRARFADAVSVALLQDQLARDDVPVDDVASAKLAAEDQVRRCLRGVRARCEQEIDCCVAELVAARFKPAPAQRGAAMHAVATAQLQEFLVDDHVHVVSAPSRPVVVDGDEHCVTFMLLTSASYRSSTLARKEVLRLDVKITTSTDTTGKGTAIAATAPPHGAGCHTEDRLTAVIAAKCSLPASSVSVRRVSGDGRSPAAAGMLSFLVVLPALCRQFVVLQCRSGANPVAMALAESGVTAVRCLEDKQPVMLRQSGPRPGRISSFFSRLGQRGKRSTTGEDVLSAISARREQVSNYHFPSTLIAARFHLAGLQIGDIATTNIAVVGPRGAGKSSLINLLASVISHTRITPCQVGQAQSAPGEWCTTHVNPCWRHNGICLIDTPPILAEELPKVDDAALEAEIRASLGDDATEAEIGMRKREIERQNEERENAAVEEQMKLWLYGVMEGRLNRNEDMHRLSNERRDEISNCRSPPLPLADQIHAVIIVTDARTIPGRGDFTADGTPRVSTVIRQNFSKPRVRYRGMEPLAVVTNFEGSQPSRDVVDCVVHWTRALHGTRFFLDNKLDKDGWYGEALQLEALEIMTAATYSAEQYILRRRHIEQEQMQTADITDTTGVDVLLSKILAGYSFNKNKLRALAVQLQAQGIHSKRGVVDSWSVVQDVVGANTVIFDKLRQEMAPLGLVV